MSRRIPVTLRLAAALIVLCAVRAQAQQAGTTASLQGTVVNAVTHQPIARALVSLDQYNQAMLTDNEGRFAFDHVPVGQTMLSARKPGFSSGMSSENRQGFTVPSSSEITLELIPQSSITGELILPNDDSPDLLQLQLLHQEIQNGRANWAMYRNAEATNDGHFRFGNLQAGAYLVHVGASPDPVPALPPGGTVKIRSGYVPAFYPAAREIAAAGVITLSPGQQADIKMELIREPFYPVTIPVANVEDARGIGFEVSSESFLGLSARFSPQDGAAHIDLPSGHYLLEGHSFGQRQMDGLREFDVNAPTRTGAITLLPVSRIPVTVHAEFTHTSVQTVNDPGASPPTATGLLDLNLQRAGGGPATHGQRPYMQDDAHAAASGTSYLMGATPGKYWVNARPFNGYIAAMTSGGVDLLEAPLTVSPDGSAAPIDVALRDDMGSLSASFASNLLSAGQPGLPYVYLTFIPRSGTAVERTDSFPLGGTETLTNVVPGSYLAFASMTPLQIEYRSSLAMAALTGKGHAVTIEPGGTASITFDSLFTPVPAP